MWIWSTLFTWQKVQVLEPCNVRPRGLKLRFIGQADRQTICARRMEFLLKSCMYPTHLLRHLYLSNLILHILLS
jgi:hypothetical protein